MLELKISNTQRLGYQFGELAVFNFLLDNLHQFVVRNAVEAFRYISFYKSGDWFEVDLYVFDGRVTGSTGAESMGNIQEGGIEYDL